MMPPTSSKTMQSPYVTYDELTRLWTLEREFLIQSRGYWLTVPGGFRFDLASIPRVLWNVIAPFELSIAAPLIHDWLYEHGGMIEAAPIPLAPFVRADADAFLLDIMQHEGVSWLRRQAAYRAVRLFGGSAWQSPDPSPSSTSSVR